MKQMHSYKLTVMIRKKICHDNFSQKEFKVVIILTPNKTDLKTKRATMEKMILAWKEG